MANHTKSGSAAAIAFERAGLRELSQAARHGGAPCVQITGYGAHSISTAHLPTQYPTARAAYLFGQELALTHAYCPSGQRVYGQAPAGYIESWGATGNMGQAALGLVAADSPSRRFGEFYAADRLLPYLPEARANGSISAADVRCIERVAERLRDGVFDAPQPQAVRTQAALIHGDLWSGNILWTHSDARYVRSDASPTFHCSSPISAPLSSNAQQYEEVPTVSEQGNSTTYPIDPPVDPHGLSFGTCDEPCVGVLIDPACHGGHGESDLAQLHVFGAPFIHEIYAGYQAVSPLASGWQERIGLHQLHMLIVHAALFGGSYGRETVAVARAYV
ncbi:fructosamine kinase family protein [Trueperella sp. LYQ143]|uniref:fructosamine kinase family protein n=1 Tax=unclassified Trueperella TaxID=2630174 RepID=UPI003983153F